MAVSLGQRELLNAGHLIAYYQRGAGSKQQNLAAL